MATHEARAAEAWLLSLDLLSARLLVWVATAGRDAELTPEAHRYLSDRYHRLAHYHRTRGRLDKARRVQARADDHYDAGGGDGPPYAAAMAMPRPSRWARTDAISRTRAKEPDDAA